MSSKEIGIEQARKILGNLALEVQRTGQSIVLTRGNSHTPIARITPLETPVTYTAEIGIGPRISLNGMCGVTVTPDVETGTGTGMENVDTPIPADQAADMERDEVIRAAETVLTVNGWTVDGDWMDGDDSHYATVRPA